MQSPSSNPPDWVSESKVIAEALSYARTFRDAARNPWKFASEWASGTRQTMNPLTFFSITVGGVFAARSGLRWLLNDESPQTIADKSSVPSFVIPVLMGLYLHRAMLRKTDARLSLTIGAIFFALGSWGAVVSVLLIGARIGISPAELTPDRVLAGDGAGRSLLSMSVISAIARSAAVGVFVAGAHQRKVVTAIAWCLSFYLLLVVIGLGLVAAGSALKAL